MRACCVRASAQPQRPAARAAAHVSSARAGRPPSPERSTTPTPRREGATGWLLTPEQQAEAHAVQGFMQDRAESLGRSRPLPGPHGRRHGGGRWLAAHGRAELRVRQRRWHRDPAQRPVRARRAVYLSRPRRQCAPDRAPEHLAHRRAADCAGVEGPQHVGQEGGQPCRAPTSPPASLAACRPRRLPASQPADLATCQPRRLPASPPASLAACQPRRLRARAARRTVMRAHDTADLARSYHPSWAPRWFEPDERRSDPDHARQHLLWTRPTRLCC